MPYGFLFIQLIAIREAPLRRDLLFSLFQKIAFFLERISFKETNELQPLLAVVIIISHSFLGENGVKDISISRRDLSLFLGINLVSVSPLHCIHLNAFLAKGSGNFARYSFFCLACVTIKFTQKCLKQSLLLLCQRNSNQCFLRPSLVS